MSTRIHELAKQYNREPKELLAWLKEHGFVSADTKSVSSTVSKIYVDELEKLLGNKSEPVATPAVPAPAEPVTNEPSKVNDSRRCIRRGRSGHRAREGSRRAG